jgi:hypothetical protein
MMGDSSKCSLRAERPSRVGELSVPRRTECEVGCESIHEPSVKDGLRGDVEKPGQSRLEVVYDRKQGATAEHLAKLEAGFALRSEQDAPGDVEELPVTAAPLRSKSKLEKYDVQRGDDEAETLARVEVDPQ